MNHCSDCDGPLRNNLETKEIACDIIECDLEDVLEWFESNKVGGKRSPDDPLPMWLEGFNLKSIDGCCMWEEDAILLLPP
mmetsp:Transcript_1757/g.3382  ORF Transcript_1757/g.3382 Transcript_1757/m.3382 type:complete len:80 (-) Transcript_1757:741-980(-)